MKILKFYYKEEEKLVVLWKYLDILIMFFLYYVVN